MNITDLYYDYPQAANLLFLVPIFLILFWLLYQHRQRILGLYACSDKLQDLLISQPFSNYWLKATGLLLTWIFLTLALMQPKGNAHYPPSLAQAQQQSKILRLQPHEVVFLMDSSASMSTPDGRLGQSRLENAKEIADQIISKLQGQSGSLYAFTSDVSKLSPPSMDYLFMRLMLRNITINEGDASGTDLKKALQYFHDHYLTTASPLIKTLIIFSDGEDNHFEELQNEARDSYIQEVVDLLGKPEEHKLRVYTIGLGTKRGAEIPHLTYQGQPVISHLTTPLLEALSTKGNGKYYPASEYAAIDIATDLAEQIAKADVFSTVDLTQQINPKEDLIYDLYFQFPLALAILLWMLYLFAPETQVSLNEKLRRKNA